MINSMTTAFGNINQDSSLALKKGYSKPSSLFLFTLGYRMPLNKSAVINSGHGFYIEGGINPGRLISKNLVIGLYGGWSFMDKSWATSFNENFSNDYGASIKNYDNLSDLDTTIINSSVDLFKNTKGYSNIMPGCEMKSFHNYSLYYGITIKLPFKYSPTLKLYKGTMRSHYQGDGNIATKHKDYNIFQLRRDMYGCELMILNIEQLFSRKKSQQKTFNHRGAGLSIYYESYNFYNSSLYFYDGTITHTLPLQKFATTSFLEKYKHESAYGFKLCFYIM